MTYIETIREGIRLANRNWQVVIIQFVMSIISCIGFFVIMGIPIIVAVMALGIDAKELLRLSELFRASENPMDLMERYFGIGILLAVAFALYMLFAFSIWIYVFGGSAGVIGRSVQEPGRAFNLKEFFGDAGRLFLPLAGYVSIITLLFIAVLFVLGMLGAIIAVAIGLSWLKEIVFLRIFFGLVIITIGLLLTFASMAVTLYGTAILVLEAAGPLEALKRTYRYFRTKPSSLWLYGIILLGLIFINAVFFLISLAFQAVPVVGPVMALPYQFFLTAISGYLNLVVLAIVFVDFFSQGSTQAVDTSCQGVFLQAPPPQMSD